MKDMAARANLSPIISKNFCSASQVILTVRNRPHAANGGGFVVTDSNQRVAFKVDGCGITGHKGELIQREGNGVALLVIRRKGGIAQALSFQNQWKGYASNYEGAQKLVFSLKEPKSFCTGNDAIRVTTKPKGCTKDWDYEIEGSFPDRKCKIIDPRGNIVAQVGIEKEVEELMVKKDVYHVLVQAGFDQAFVIGVIAVLDNIHGESTHWRSKALLLDHSAFRESSSCFGTQRKNK